MSTKLSLAQEKEYDEAKKKIDEALTVKSRTALGLCNNDGCYNLRRPASAYCTQCSIKAHEAEEYINKQ